VTWRRYTLAWFDRWYLPLLILAGLLALPWFLRYFLWAAGIPTVLP